HLQEGDPIEISNDLGSYQGTVRFAPIRPRNVQIYWPEGNVLIRRGVLDPTCEMPDYNALVRIEAVRPAAVNAWNVARHCATRTCGRSWGTDETQRRIASPPKNRR